MEKKQGCLLKIKTELLRQLEERKSQVVSLEKSVSDLRDEVRDKEEIINNLQSLPRSKIPRKKFLANIKSHFQKPRGLRSVSMPGNLDSVGRSKKSGILRARRMRGDLEANSPSCTANAQTVSKTPT